MCILMMYSRGPSGLYYVINRLCDKWEFEASVAPPPACRCQLKSAISGPYQPSRLVSHP